VPYLKRIEEAEECGRKNLKGNEIENTLVGVNHNMIPGQLAQGYLFG